MRPRQRSLRLILALPALLLSCKGPVAERPDAAADGGAPDATSDAALDGAPDGAPTHCSDLGDADRCVGSVLYLCHGQWLRTLDCAGLGGVCDDSGARAGCVPAAGGTHRARGRVTRDLRPYTPAGLGDVQRVPAAHATAVIVDATTDQARNFGVTDEDGRYDILYPPGSGDVRLRLLTLAFDPEHRLTVTDGDNAAYAFDSAPVADTSRDVTLDLHVAEAEDAGALHIFELLRGHQSQAQQLTPTLLPLLQAIWERGATLQCGTCFERAPPTLFVLGDPQDTDEFDDCVISHEFGHYLAFTASRDDTPGGAHDGSPTDPRQAWSEGLATWIGQTLLDEPLYVDTQATGVTVRDPEDMGWDADPAGPLDQDLSEYVVLETLWDLTDPASGSLDPMARPAADVFDVLTAYLPSDGLVDRGHLGVDLVDFLDGWFCRGHGDRAGITALVVTDQGFPYDFAGPATCPKPRAALQVRLATVPSPRRAGARDAMLRVVDPRGTSRARATLRFPPGPRRATPPPRDLGRLSPGTPREVRWALPPGRAPRWIAAGVTVTRGRGSRIHASQRLWLRPPPTPRARVRRVDRGGLLRFRIRARR